MKIMNKLIPSLIKRKILDALEPRRKKVVSQLPKTFLQEKHVKNCRLVLNRSSMLNYIGQQDVVAELGVNRGEFSEMILEVTNPAVLQLVDIWDSQRYHDGLFKEVSAKFGREIENGRVVINRMLSTEAACEFPDEYFDMVYIDTDHSYRTTREELLAYSKKMKPTGIIAGHDYSMGNWIKSYRYGVIEAVHEFCVEFDWELYCLTVEPQEYRSFAIRRIK